MTEARVCPCEACTVAGCDRPPVALAAVGAYPARELHGRELVRFYADQDRRAELFARVKADLQLAGFKAQRGDELL